MKGGWVVGEGKGGEGEWVERGRWMKVEERGGGRTGSGEGKGEIRGIDNITCYCF